MNFTSTFSTIAVAFIYEVLMNSSPTSYSEPNSIICIKIHRSFWITWNGGKVKVGTGLTIADSTLLMEYSDPSPLPISAVTISTGWGASGVWQVSTPVQGEYIESQPCCIVYYIPL